ncbi:hypothetical protein Tco_0329851, partial [Tanacetum coccineum]
MMKILLMKMEILEWVKHPREERNLTNMARRTFLDGKNSYSLGLTLVLYNHGGDGGACNLLGDVIEVLGCLLE